MLLLALCAVGIASAAPDKSDSSDFASFYHTTDEIVSEAQELQRNGCDALAVTFEGEGKVVLPVFTIGFDHGSATVRAFMLYGEHARELITSETALGLVRALCEGAAKPGSAAERLLAAMQIIMYPVVNVDGRRIVERNGDYCRRTNARGVDLNRNWNDHWTRSSPLDPDQYGGAVEFSEDETNILRRALAEARPDVFVTVHSGVLGMYTPYAWSGKLPDDATTVLLETDGAASSRATRVPQRVQTALGILDRANKKYCNCAMGPAGAAVGYLCPGTCLDFAYDQGVQIVLAVEIYQKDSDNGFSNNSPKAKSLLQTREGKLGSERRSRARGHDHHHRLPRSNKTGSPRSCFLQTSQKRSSRSESVVKDQKATRRTRFPKPSDRESADCLESFNPSTKEAYENTVANWVSALTQILGDALAAKISNLQTTPGIS